MRILRFSPRLFRVIGSRENRYISQDHGQDSSLHSGKYHQLVFYGKCFGKIN